MSNMKKSQRQIAHMLRRSLSYRDYPINDNEAKDSYKVQELCRRSGFNHGLAFALAILVLNDSDGVKKQK